MFAKNSKILVLAPHTDDGEIGCGGTIHRLLREGHTVFYMALSTCDQSLPPGYPPGTLVSEVKEATSILGIDATNLFIFDFEVRKLAERRQELLEILVNFNRTIDPDVVLTTSINDIHQDHCTVALETNRAFKEKIILAYEMPQNNLIFETRCYISLQESDLLAKLNALNAYGSQFSRPYFNDKFVRSLATVRGASVKKEYAEVFDVVRIVL